MSTVSFVLGSSILRANTLTDLQIADLFALQLPIYYTYVPTTSLRYLLLSPHTDIVQYLQFGYQKGLLYRLKALGERHNMDITIEGFHSWMWRGLSFLLPFLFGGYTFQAYNAWTLYKLTTYPPGAPWHVSMLETRLLAASVYAPSLHPYILSSQCLSSTFNLLFLILLLFLLFACCLPVWLAACVIYWVGTWVTVGSSGRLAAGTSTLAVQLESVCTCVSV